MRRASAQRSKRARAHPRMFSQMNRSRTDREKGQSNEGQKKKKATGAHAFLEYEKSPGTIGETRTVPREGNSICPLANEYYRKLPLIVNILARNASFSLRDSRFVHHVRVIFHRSSYRRAFSRFVAGMSEFQVELRPEDINGLGYPGNRVFIGDKRCRCVD